MSELKYFYGKLLNLHTGECSFMMTKSTYAEAQESVAKNFPWYMLKLCSKLAKALMYGSFMGCICMEGHTCMGWCLNGSKTYMGVYINGRLSIHWLVYVWKIRMHVLVYVWKAKHAWAGV
jgi:hypothetical protein